jgi:hypothetical protein
VGDVRAEEHRRVVSGLVLEADRRGLDRRPERADEAHHDGGHHQDRGRDDHGEGRTVLAAGRFAGLLAGLPGHLRVFGRPVTEAVEHAAGHPQHGASHQGRAHDQDGDQPRARAGLDPALAEEGGERGQVGQPESGQGEHHSGDAERAAAPVQPGFVDRAEPVQHDAGAQEQRRLDQPVADDVDGGAGQAERGEQGDTDEEHASVADRGEREHPLDVPLAEAEQRPGHGGQQAETEEDVTDARPVPERLTEQRPVDPGDPVQPQFHHHAGEQHADRGRRDRVGVREPEVERHDRALDQQARDDQEEGDDHQPVRRVLRDRHADLGHVQRSGPPVDQRDAGQRQVGPDAVGDGEVERALDRPAFLRPVGGQRVGRHPHQLEPHEQVEQVPGEAESGDAGQEGQHQGVVVGRDPVEVPPGKRHRGGHQDRRQAGEPRADRLGLEIDAEGHPVRGPEPGEPVDLIAARRPDHDHEKHDRDRGGGQDRYHVEDPAPAAEQRTAHRDRGGHEQRHHDDEGEQLVHGAALSLQRGQFLRVQGAEPLVGLDREGQQHGGDGGLDHHVGEGAGLHHGIDRGGVVGDVEEVGRDAPGHVADPEQQHVGRRLDHDQADDLVHQVPAGDHAVQSDTQDPGHDHERENLHLVTPFS